MCDLSTPHFSVDDCDRVYLKCVDDLVELGHIDDCDDEVPTRLLAELDQLRTMRADAIDYGRACAATAQAADEMRHSPEAWR